MKFAIHIARSRDRLDERNLRACRHDVRAFGKVVTLDMVVALRGDDTSTTIPASTTPSAAEFLTRRCTA